ncbi:tRNA pseudouridine synthase A [Candidatus Burkholderia brachyanthoides]|nr:tRNA pseudouridine synthase A [Candidatus Burkholderia brachyanthoides]
MRLKLTAKHPRPTSATRSLVRAGSSTGRHKSTRPEAPEHRAREGASPRRRMRGARALRSVAVMSGVLSSREGMSRVLVSAHAASTAATNDVHPNRAPTTPAPAPAHTTTAPHPPRNRITTKRRPRAPLESDVRTRHLLAPRSRQVDRKRLGACERRSGRHARHAHRADGEHSVAASRPLRPGAPRRSCCTKPVGYVSGQAEDGYEPAVTLIDPANQWSEGRSGIRFTPNHLRSIASAGRLDIDSTGLLVQTQDGRIAQATNRRAFRCRQGVPHARTVR